MNDLALTVRLNADGSGLRGELRVSKEEIAKLKRELGDAGTEANQAAGKLDKYGQEAGQASQQSRRLKQETRGVTAAMKSLRGLIGGFGFYAVAKSMLVSISAMQGLRSRLADLVGGTRAYNQENEYLIELAQRMSTDLNALRENYARTLTLEKAGILTRQEAREITEGMINVQAKLGASTIQLNQAMYGLTQGLSAGTLRAEELNQVTEPLPGLLQELDKAAGLSAGGFRRMVNEGRVTSSFFKTTLIKALREYEGAAESMSGNLSQMWTRVKNEYRLLVETLEEPVSAVVGPVLDGLASSLEKLGAYITWFKTEGMPLLRDAVVDDIGAIQKAWDWLKTNTVIVWESIHLAAVKAVQAVRDKLGDMYLSLSKAANALGFDDLSSALFTAAAKMQSFDNEVGQIEQRIKTLRKEHAKYVKTVDANVAEYKKWNWETSRQAKSLDDVVRHLKKVNTATHNNAAATNTLSKALQNTKQAVAQNMQALVKQYIALTQGARAAYEYSLRTQGMTESEIQAQLALWDTVHALEAKKAAEEKAARAAAKHASINTATANEFQKVWENAVSSVDNIFRDLWRGAFSGAKDFGQSLKEWFTNLLAELAHAALTRPIVLSLGASLAAGPGQALAGGATAPGGAGSLLGNLGSVVGGGSILAGVGSWLAGTGVAAGSGFLSGVAGGLINAGTLGIGGTLSTIGAGLTSGTLAGFGAALGAAAPFLLPLALLAGAGSFHDKESPTKFHLSAEQTFMQKSGADRAPLGAISLSPSGKYVRVNTAFGAMGLGVQHAGKEGQMSNEDARRLAQETGALFQRFAALDATLADLIGPDGLARVQTAMGDFAKDLASEKLDLKGWLQARYDTVFGAVGGQMESIYRAMTTVSADADMSEIVGQVTAFFSTLDTYRHAFADYEEQVRQAGLTQTEVMAEFTRGLYEQIAAYDGSIDANRQLTAGLQQRYQMELKYLAQIDAAQRSVTATLGQSIEAIRLSQMTDKQRYDYQKRQAEALASALADMTDPARITETVNEINRLTMAAWNSLADAQKAQVAGGFEQFLSAVEERANAQLDKARESLRAEHDALVQAYTDMAAAARDLASAVGATQAGDQAVDASNDATAIINSLAVNTDTLVTGMNQAAEVLQAAAQRLDQAAGTFGGWVGHLPASFQFNIQVEVPEVGS